MSKMFLDICSCLWLGIYFLRSALRLRCHTFLRDAIISSKQTMLGSGKDLMSKGWISDLFHVYCFGRDPALEPGV